MIALLSKYWFLVGLALAMASGYAFADWLEPLGNSVWLRRTIVMLVMFLMALPLSLATIRETVRKPWAAMLASTVNMGLFPIAALGISVLVDSSFQAGFLVIAATPCTLASAAVWTRRAGGNDVTALMTTVITNSMSFLVTPLIIFLLLKQSAEVHFGVMVMMLGLLVLLPMMAAQLLATRQPVGKWAEEHKGDLLIVAQIGILLIVLFGTVQTSLSFPEASKINPGPAFRLGLNCFVLHLSLLVPGYYLARGFGFSRADQIAVAFGGSQKTLMIGLLICIQLNVSLLPMVIYHAVQLVLDTLIADWFVSRGRSDRNTT